MRPVSFRVTPDYVSRLRAAEDIVDEVSALGFKEGSPRVFFRQVEAYPVGVVEEESPAKAVVHDQGERGGGVHVVVIVVVSHRGVVVPEVLPGAGLLQTASPLAAGEIPLALFPLFVEPHRVSGRQRGTHTPPVSARGPYRGLRRPKQRHGRKNLRNRSGKGSVKSARSPLRSRPPPARRNSAWRLLPDPTRFCLRRGIS